jgi:hypothetical protein
MKTKRSIKEWCYNGVGGMENNFSANNRKWTETNKDTYFDQLGVLLPLYKSKNAFMVGECYDVYKSNRCYASFIIVEDRYFGIIRSDFEPEKWEQEIREQFSF